MIQSRYVRSLFIISLLGLCACASVTDSVVPSSAAEASSANKVVQNLPPQNLLPGQCGLFIWTADNQNKFIGFETESSATYVLNGHIRRASRLDNTTLDAPKRRYQTLNEGSLAEMTFELSLQRDVEISEGERFYGRLSTKTEDGWDRVTPIAALLSCSAV
ncbi:hypothetical protein DES40_1465 [Litorimonas taeanensis]|uniref:Lipoprotein n=1 Tax=Litorimonas taeanensis TaxID=568099 RepID=A0A420WM60_9PROT|nr:hypothetical protein [Litorimonas taeanensis]RKQ72128.1 hypothetical protein DES40_1465 [Litorimonas taeanensis]